MAFLKTGRAPAKIVSVKGKPEQVYIRGNVVSGKVELLDPDSLSIMAVEEEKNLVPGVMKKGQEKKA